MVVIPDRQRKGLTRDCVHKSVAIAEHSFPHAVVVLVQVLCANEGDEQCPQLYICWPPVHAGRANKQCRVLPHAAAMAKQARSGLKSTSRAKGQRLSSRGW